MKLCQECNKEFIPNSGKQVCCSRKCNVNKWRKANPEKTLVQQKKNNEKRKGVYRYNSETRKNWYKQKKEDVVWVDKVNTKARERNKIVKNFINEYKLLQGCKDCGYNKHHVALDFDHISNDKELNVCNAKSIDQAKKEIEKCEVVCSNCHRIRTYERLIRNI
jgi:hypothetical protein